jgi:hypothetical protein
LIFDIKDMGSIPILCILFPFSLKVEQWFCKPKVIGASPIRGNISCCV